MTPSSWHRTKIVCTLGPATDAPGVIKRLISSGMDIARVNTSHGDHAEHGQRIQQVRQAAQESGQPVAILVDLPGPKFRLAELPDGCCKLVEGETVILVDEDSYARVGNTEEDGNYLPVRNPELLEVLHVGERVFLADGLIELSIETVVSARARCKIIIGGAVRSGSGINNTGIGSRRTGSNRGRPAPSRVCVGARGGMDRYFLCAAGYRYPSRSRAVARLARSRC